MANAQAGIIDFTDMGPEQLTTIFVKNDLTLLDSADLRGWIAALASAQVLNKPRLAANANKLAKVLVSETGLGAETGNDLATLALEDLASFMSRADAYAIYNMLDGLCPTAMIATSPERRLQLGHRPPWSGHRGRGSARSM